jgi:hypothetical protein
VEILSKYITQVKLQRIVAGLLLFSFLLIPFVEAFHHHNRNPGLKDQVYQTRKAGVAQYKNHNSCKICDYLKNNNNHQINNKTAIFTIFLQPVVLKGEAFLQHITSALVFCYANKGPPLLTAFSD